MVDAKALGKRTLEQAYSVQEPLSRSPQARQESTSPDDEDIVQREVYTRHGLIALLKNELLLGRISARIVGKEGFAVKKDTLEKEFAEGKDKQCVQRIMDDMNLRNVRGPSYVGKWRTQRLSP